MLDSCGCLSEPFHFNWIVHPKESESPMGSLTKISAHIYLQLDWNIGYSFLVQSQIIHCEISAKDVDVPISKAMLGTSLPP